MEDLLTVLFVLAIYSFPTWTAYGRHAPSPGSVAVVNLLLGWTVIGWVVALAMAYRDPKPAPAAQLPAARSLQGLGGGSTDHDWRNG